MTANEMWKTLKATIEKKQQPAEKDEHAMGYFQALADVKGWMHDIEKVRWMEHASSYVCRSPFSDLEFSSKEEEDR